MPSFTRRVRPGVTTSSGASGIAGASGDTPGAAGPSTTAPATSTPPAGTKPYLSAPTRFVSSGVASLDDVLGGGVPLGGILTLLAPDVHTQWARLVARHAAAQGVLDGQRVVVLAPKDVAGDWVRGMPWVEGGDAAAGAGAPPGGAPVGAPAGGDESDAEPEEDNPSRTKIAWRYDRLGRVRTTVGSSALAANTTIPPNIRADLERTGGTVYVDPGTGVASALEALAKVLDTPAPSGDGAAPVATRVVVPDLGGPDWPTTSPNEVLRFLYALRALLRGRAAVGVITLPPSLSETAGDDVGGGDKGTSGTTPWVAGLSHASDACITLRGFGASPGHFRAFHPLHGLLTPHTLPATHHVLAPALRHSTLLGVRDGGEQNLGFRLRRKRWVVESVHLGIEGGTSERRTEPPPAPPASNPATRTSHEPTEGIEPAAVPPPASTTTATATSPPAAPSAKPKIPRARVRFGEDVDEPPPSAHHHGHTHAPGHAPRVEIRHDRPDLYEF